MPARFTLVSKRQPNNRRARLAETDLYGPVRDWLVAQDYIVRGEVHNCDIVATRGDDLVVIELKRALNISLLAQAVQRQRMTDSVYVAVPRPPDKRKWMMQFKGVFYLLRRLELGLILVGTIPGKPNAEVVLHPEPHERHKKNGARRALLREIEHRSGDHNEGGSCRRKLVTAYRENAIRIAVCLCVRGPMAPRVLRSLGTGEKTLSILHSNYYGWFERVERGVYALSPRGQTELETYPELAQQFRSDLSSSLDTIPAPSSE